MKATHNGQCQLCGRKQKLPNNRLSLHGYTKDWGFFNGTCPGSREEPFEVSIQLIQGQIALVRSQKASIEQDIIELNTTPYYWIHEYRPATWEVRHSSYVWRHLTDDEVSLDEYGRIAWTVESGKDKGRVRHQNPGVSKATMAKVRQAYRAKEIQGLDRYIAWQEDRIKGWAPSDREVVA